MTTQIPPLRLLVVDDSAYNRRHMAEVFASHPEVEIVGKAGDGEEALRLALTLKPDVITLDLEMPKMDGFTFLRIMMVKQPTPIIVMSSYAQKENVFKALELGAVDFVTKSDRQILPDATDVREQIVAKVLLARSLHLKGGRGLRAPAPSVPQIQAAPPAAVPYVLPTHLVAIASSTGGPTALLDIFAKVPASSTCGFVVAQHMPDKFTRTFAERLNKKGAVRCAEAQDGDKVAKMTGFVCPGRQCMEVSLVQRQLRLSVKAGASEDRYVPSADRLLKSAAAAMGSRSVAVILTGMGDDGTEGARAVRDAGGIVLAESQETAVVYGMPGSAVRAGVVTKELPLPQIVEYIAGLSS